MKGTYRKDTVEVYTLRKALNALKTTYTNDPTLYIVLGRNQYYNYKQGWHYYLFIHLLVVYRQSCISKYIPSNGWITLNN